jgi:hypothetical protein
MNSLSQDDAADQTNDMSGPCTQHAVDESHAVASSSLYQSTAHSTGILFENAVTRQQLQNIQGLTNLFDIPGMRKLFNARNAKKTFR